MKAYELMDYVYGMSVKSEKTCDKLVFGNIDKKIKKVAVTCIATADVIKEAINWGADLIITHEPTFFEKDDPVSLKKKELLDGAEITVYRFHDGMHKAEVDMIAEGQLKSIGLKGRYEKGEYYVANRFYLDEPKSSTEIAEIIKDKLGLSHIRICGDLHTKSSKVSLCFGATGESLYNELKNSFSEIIIAGEVCEWQCCEYARDAAALGINKSIITLGHMVSERDGMKFLAEKIEEKYSDFETKYFDCKDVYSD